MAPPFCPITYGNLQIFPNPTAEPIVVIINAYFDVQLGLSFSKIATFLTLQLLLYTNLINMY